MSNKNDFSNKYNFDIKDELLSKNKPKAESDSNNISILKALKGEDTLSSSSLKVEIQIDNPEDIKKIKIDSKTYYQNLRRKVLLNYKLGQLFIENFYRDEFNLSRKSSYLIFGLPVSVLVFFTVISPYNPFFGIMTKISIFGSLITFGYYFNLEMTQAGRNPYTDLGVKIRKIKNELVLYNPLSNPILESDLKNKKV